MRCMCDLVSFSFSEHYLRGEMLDNRIKPKIFVPFIERGFIFVQYSQKNQRWCFSLPLILFWFTPCGQARRYRAKRVRHRIGLSCNAKRPENIIENAFTLLDFRGNRACRNSVMAYVFFTARDPAEDLSHMREDLLAAVKISENRCNPQRARRPMDL